jgi:uncharacterized protein (TIGR03067 family)
MLARHPVAAALLLFVAAEPAVDEQARKDRDRLQGAWELVSVEQDGMPAPRLARIWAKVVIDGDALTRFVIPSEENVRHKHTYQLDAGSNPRLIDFTRSEGPRSGARWEGIYRVEKDALKLCFNLTAGVKQRPGDFAAPENSGCCLMVFERVQP